MSKPAPEPVEGPPVLRRASAKPKPADDAPGCGAGKPRPGFSRSPSFCSGTFGPSARGIGRRFGPAGPEAARRGSRSGCLSPSPAAAEAEAEADPDRPVLKRGAPTAEELKKRSTLGGDRQRQPRKTRTSPRLPPRKADPSSSRPFRMPQVPTRVLMPTASSLKRNRSCARKFWLWRRTKCGPGRRSRNRSRRSRRPALPGPRSKAKSPQPTFEDVQLHAFDLSNSNEPVLVLTAKARMPARPNAASDLQYIITLVARDDIYGDLHKAFASVTDTGISTFCLAWN